MVLAGISIASASKLHLFGMLRKFRLWMVVLQISDDRRLTPENQRKCSNRLPVQFVSAKLPQFSDFFLENKQEYVSHRIF